MVARISRSDGFRNGRGFWFTDRGADLRRRCAHEGLHLDDPVEAELPEAAVLEAVPVDDVDEYSVSVNRVLMLRTSRPLRLLSTCPESFSSWTFRCS
jgi:hypothetical protein